MGLIRNDLSRWEVLPLSLIRAGVNNTNEHTAKPIFPVPILTLKIPTSTFKIIIKWLSNFMWQKKRPIIIF